MKEKKKHHLVFCGWREMWIYKSLFREEVMLKINLWRKKSSLTHYNKKSSSQHLGIIFKEQKEIESIFCVAFWWLIPWFLFQKDLSKELHAVAELTYSEETKPLDHSWRQNPCMFWKKSSVKRFFKNWLILYYLLMVTKRGLVITT